jgi:hypothetical protein
VATSIGKSILVSEGDFEIVNSVGFIRAEEEKTVFSGKEEPVTLSGEGNSATLSGFIYFNPLRICVRQ